MKLKTNSGWIKMEKQLKNPGLAAVASFFFSGLGQIYNGEIGKGFALMIVQVNYPTLKLWGLRFYVLVS
jgi:TM2 domain-containing membrane protein YozV